MYSKRSPDRNASSAAPKSKALTFCSHHLDLDLDILDQVCTCTAYKPSSLHVSPNKGIEMKTQQKILKNGGARHVDLWHDVSQTFSCLHEIHSWLVVSTHVKNTSQGGNLGVKIKNIWNHHLDSTHIMSNHQISSNLPGNSRGILPPSLRLAFIKVEVIETFTTSAKPWSVPPHGGTVDAEAAAAIGVAVAAEDVHSIGHVTPYRCVLPAGSWRHSARGQLTPAIGLAKIAKERIDLTWLRKIQSRFWLYKNGVPASSPPIGR